MKFAGEEKAAVAQGRILQVVGGRWVYGVQGMWWVIDCR